MIGAVAGALAILEVMPKNYSHTLGGPKLKVPLSTGLLAEAVLTFALTLTVLWAILRGPRSPSVKTGIIVVATIILVMAGGAYTGPAMNPANVRASFFFPFHSVSCCCHVAGLWWLGFHPDNSSRTLQPSARDSLRIVLISNWQFMFCLHIFQGFCHSFLE